MRWNARHFHIAYCMLRGRKHEEIEPRCHEEPSMTRVEKIAIEGEAVRHRVVGGFVAPHDTGGARIVHCQRERQQDEADA